MTDLTHEALEALRIVIEAAEPMRLKEQADCLLGTKHRNPIQKAITKLEALRTGQLIHAVPSGDEVEAVARHLCEREILKAYTRPDRADELKEFRKIEVDHLWENYKDQAIAAITTLDAVRGKQ